MKIVTATGLTIATVTPRGEWTWVNRAAAPPGFAAWVDQPELYERDGGLIKGVLGSQLLTRKRGTPEWLDVILNRIVNMTDLIWQED